MPCFCTVSYRKSQRTLPKGFLIKTKKMQGGILLRLGFFVYLFLIGSYIFHNDFFTIYQKISDAKNRKTKISSESGYRAFYDSLFPLFSNLSLFWVSSRYLICFYRLYVSMDLMKIDIILTFSYHLDKNLSNWVELLSSQLICPAFVRERFYSIRRFCCLRLHLIFLSFLNGVKLISQYLKKRKTSITWLLNYISSIFLVRNASRVLVRVFGGRVLGSICIKILNLRKDHL